jgi:hypothetical protein
MKHLEENLRAAVEDLAASAPPLNDMAMVARIRGRRIRRRRQTVLGAVVVMLAGMAVTPFAVLDGHRDGQRPHPVASVPPSESPVIPAPMPSTTVTVPKIGKDWWMAPIKLPGGLVITSVGRSEAFNSGNTVRDGNITLNRSTGRYLVFPIEYQVFTAAPTGRYVLVEAGSGDGYVPIGFLNSVTGKIRLLGHGSGSGVEWSADGKRVLLTLNGGGFRLIDAKTTAETDREIPNAKVFCPDYCFFTWMPGGKEVALAQRDPEVERSEALASTIKSIDVYSVESGKLLRTLPVPGVPAGSAAWSPDGRYVALMPDASEENGTRIAEVATGRVVTTLPLASQVRFLPDNQILTLGGPRGLDVTVYDLAGNVRATGSLPADFVGRQVTIGVE